MENMPDNKKQFLNDAILFSLNRLIFHAVVSNRKSRRRSGVKKRLFSEVSRKGSQIIV
jgi:hypothetical protein